MKPPYRIDMAASVRARLLTRAKERGEDFQLTLVRYAIERFLYRLGKSAYRDTFVLKGAMLFALWSVEPFRATGDLDLLGLGAIGERRVRAMIEDVAAMSVEPDGGLVRRRPIARRGDAGAGRIQRYTSLFPGSDRLCLSNNVAERAIRGIAVGRRNWTFAGSDRGGARAAAMYTLMETAKLNDIDPHAWLGSPMSSRASPRRRATASQNCCRGTGTGGNWPSRPELLRPSPDAYTLRGRRSVPSVGRV